MYVDRAHVCVPSGILVIGVTVSDRGLFDERVALAWEGTAVAVCANRLRVTVAAQLASTQFEPSR